MNKAVWGIFALAVLPALCGTGTSAVHAQRAAIGAYNAAPRNPSADGRGTITVGKDHHIGQFSFAVTLGHNGPEGSFEFNEKNVPGQNVQHILLRPIDRLSIQGHTAQFEGATVWHDSHARVRVIAVDNGDHQDSLSVRVVATDGANAGKAVYEVGGILTSGEIHVFPQ
jgi:hypothetical protein